MAKAEIVTERGMTVKLRCACGGTFFTWKEIVEAGALVSCPDCRQVVETATLEVRPRRDGDDVRGEGW